MARTSRITNVIKIAEFPELYASFNTMDKSEQCYWNVIELIQKQTEAKQAKWWAYYDARKDEETFSAIHQEWIDANVSSKVGA